MVAGGAWSRTTWLVDELIADQLVTKERNAADGRGFDVTLTEEDLAALQWAYPVHLRSARTCVLDHVAGPSCRASPGR